LLEGIDCVVGQNKNKLCVTWMIRPAYKHMWIYRWPKFFVSWFAL